ncbi:MAG: (Fe-S)-binding protein [Bacteroidota bacterium]
MEFKIDTMAECMARGEAPEVLFWVGCAGSFDERAQKVTKAVAKLLHHAKVSFAVLGTEESCTGDPAKRAGNEFLFQMQAMTNIQVMKGYEVKKIVTACPHCFNTLKNEYPSLARAFGSAMNDKHDGFFEVLHHTQLLQQLIDQGRLRITGGAFAGKRIVFHDPCYLGRGNDVYEAPRELIMNLDAALHEMKRSRSNGLCCGAGGAQMFKEPETGDRDINIERTEEALQHSPEIIAVGCPFCMTMLTDGVKHFEKEAEVKVLDVAELLTRAADL